MIEFDFSVVLCVVEFLYAWQMTGCVHIIGHYVTARSFRIPARVIIPWQRFVPVWGWYWNITQPHSAMMCQYDKYKLSTATPTKRTLIGFAGPYTQLLFIIAVGTLFLPCVSELCGGSVLFSLLMCIWQLLYFVWYAIHFHTDGDSDFRLFHDFNSK